MYVVIGGYIIRVHNGRKLIITAKASSPPHPPLQLSYYCTEMYNYRGEYALCPPLLQKLINSLWFSRSRMCPFRFSVSPPHLYTYNTYYTYRTDIHGVEKRYTASKKPNEIKMDVALFHETEYEEEWVRQEKKGKSRRWTWLSHPNIGLGRECVLKEVGKKCRALRDPGRWIANRIIK